MTTALTLYDSMCRALDDATTIDAIVAPQGILDQIAHIKLHARQISDRELLAKAAAKQLWAERALGEMIAQAKGHGHFKRGNRPKGSDEVLIATLEEVGVDKKLSARAQQCARMDLSDFNAAVQSTQDRIASGTARILETAPSAHGAGRITDAADRDFSPTPPWATRALFEHVLPHIGIRHMVSVWEPACGEGHIAEVLGEYCDDVSSSDIHDYDYGQPMDFLAYGGDRSSTDMDWIITNPPFEDRVLKFMKRAINLSTVGCALFLQLRYLEGIGRYNEVFKNNPPTVITPFVERVPLLMGEYDPKASTTTAFMWLVWVHGEDPVAPFWIPPGRREALTREDDAQRFTQHPVPRRILPAPPFGGWGNDSTQTEPVWRKGGELGFWA